MIAAGRRPSLHHAEAIEGEGRRLLDPIRGIYAGDFLKILRTAAAPAVLVEVGVIKNPVAEQQLSEPHTVDTLAAAIADAVAMLPLRSEERRLGKECVSTCRSRWSTYP